MRFFAILALVLALGVVIEAKVAAKKAPRQEAGFLDFDSLVSDDDAVQMLGALFKDPEAVQEANEFLAPDRTARNVFNRIDKQRDQYMQLYGFLSEPNRADDCPALHSAAKTLQRLQAGAKGITLQTSKLSTVDQQAIRAYSEAKIGPLSHSVTSLVVNGMISCERGQRMYAQAVGGIALTSADIENLRQQVMTQDSDCIQLQNLFHDFTTEVTKFHRHAAEQFAAMRAANMMVAEGRARLELSARMAPTEREFFTTFHALWDRNCRAKVNVALGLNEDGTPASDGGAAGAAASGSAAAVGSGSAAATKSSRVQLLASSEGGRGALRQKLFAFSELDATSAGAVAPAPAPAGSASSDGGAASANASSVPADASTTPPLPITFPEAYPRTARMLLLVATVGMAACCGIFVWMRSTTSGDSSIHTVVCLLTAVAALSYFALYSGVGVSLKQDTNGVAHAILWARHYELIVTLPLLSLATSLFALTESSQTAAMMGTSALMPVAWLIGASVVGDGQYIWWTISVVFYIVLAIQLASQLSQAKDKISVLSVQTLQLLTALLAGVYVGYLAVGIVGSEGLGLISFTTEIGLLVFADLIGKLGFGFLILTSIEETVVPTGESGRLLASSRYV